MLCQKMLILRKKWLSSLLALAFLGKKSEKNQGWQHNLFKEETLVAVDLTAPINVNRRA